jgi:subtilisin family serine protease
MKSGLIVLVMGVILCTSVATGGVQKGMVPGKKQAQVSPEMIKKSRDNSEYLPDRVIVKLAPSIPSQKSSAGFGLSSLDMFVERYAAQSVARLFPAHAAPERDGLPDLSKYYVVKFSSPVDAFTVAEELSRQPEVQYAEPWFIYPVNDAALFTPNDTGFAKQWNMTQIRADSAWTLTQGDTSVVIGIIDTGVQWDHPDLAANIWINQGENGPDGIGGDKRTNGIDDDGNGKIDDYHGWDFGSADYNVFAEDNNPTPTRSSHGHGTHVAGIASAVTNNVTGVAGVGFNCRIMPVKASADNDTRGAGSTPYIIAGFEGIIYAADNGADIINLSWGGPGFSSIEQDVIDYATAKGSLVVAAAGNTGTTAEPQYPASYDKVISVAATQKGSDVKASYSSYGEFVDLSAPGGDTFTAANQIYSTYYPNTYAYITGTSMATPMAAGAAAIVKSYFPSYSPLEVGEKLRVTCDDIYTPNTAYRYKLGKGRINLYKALTVSSPSVRLSSVHADDAAGGNNNGAFEPNENIAISVDLTNYLQATSPSATAVLSTANTYVVVNSGSFPFGALAASSSTNNSGSPFQVHVNSNIPSGAKVTFLLTITDGTYIDRIEFSLLFNPTFATHYVNNVDVTLTNNGRIGFNDFPDNTQGIGFDFHFGNQLFEGGLMIGNSATKIVEVVRNAGGTQDADFSASQTYNLSTPGTYSDQDGSTAFTDNLASTTNKLGIQVDMHSYQFINPPDDDYVIVQYNIKNTNLTALNGVYAGLFFDWDMLSPDGDPFSYERNKTSYDAGRNLGYAWFDTTAATDYCGVRVLEGAASYRGLVNSTTIDLSRSAKYAWMSGGVVMENSIGDIHFAISSGPYNINAGETQRVAFALIGGLSLAELQSNADAAQAKWNYLRTLLAVGDDDGTLPTVYALHQNYPNPFNPSTVIRYDLPKSSLVTLKILNVLGQEVQTLVQNTEEDAGVHTIRFDASQLASGVYFYRLQAVDNASGSGSGFTDVKKLLLVR